MSTMLKVFCAEFLKKPAAKYMNGTEWGGSSLARTVVPFAILECGNGNGNIRAAFSTSFALDFRVAVWYNSLV